jgi:tRNA pseudouridine38-40 synthase
MPRYFLEVSYKGTNYSGFQKQENANTIQAEIEKAFSILHQKEVEFTGSSRTDAGVHALQNYFHFDYSPLLHPQFLYKMNALVPEDIVVSNLHPVAEDAHCRFNAISRVYEYHLYQAKNPFLKDIAYYFPYRINFEQLNNAARMLPDHLDFTSFSKRNTQVKTFICKIFESEWRREDSRIVYRVKANRFLRGMVRGLTGTMLKIGRGQQSVEEFTGIIEARDCSKANFAVPARGLFLTRVEFPIGILPVHSEAGS